MKPSLLLGLVAACLVFASSAHAGKYGSETQIEISGSFRTVIPDKVKNQSGGGVKVTRSFDEQAISNATILSAMKKRGLITVTKGFSIVMVGQGRLASGIKLFAVCEGVDPVEIPSDLLWIGVFDGPGKGVLQENAEGGLTKLDMETVNAATLKLKNFEGRGVLEQTWSLGTVTKNAVTESVELVKATGHFSGIVSGGNAKEGVGLVEMRFLKPKTVALKRYGMVKTATSTAGVSVAHTHVSGGSISSVDVTYAGTSPSGNFTLVDIEAAPAGSTLTGTNGMLTFNTSSIGLELAFDGAPFSLSNLTQLNELSVNTANGPVFYTRESGDVWTVVNPAPAEAESNDAESVE